MHFAVFTALVVGFTAPLPCLDLPSTDGYMNSVSLWQLGSGVCKSGSNFKAA
jgi:hypothetical protein